MIQEVIKAINKNISAGGLFQDVYELTEQVTQALPFEGENVTQTFPALYNSRGELTHVFNPDKNRSVCWHTNRGDVSISQAEQGVTACGKTFLYTYSLALVGYVVRDKICPSTYTDFNVANNLVASLKKIVVKNFIDVDVFPNTIITNKNTVASNNFVNIEMPIGFEYSFVQVNYNVVIEVNQKCLELYCK